MKEKVLADKYIQSLCNKNSKLPERVKSPMNTNERISIKLVVVKIANNILENRIVTLKGK